MKELSIILNYFNTGFGDGDGDGDGDGNGDGSRGGRIIVKTSAGTRQLVNRRLIEYLK